MKDYIYFFQAIFSFLLVANSACFSLGLIPSLAPSISWLQQLNQLTQNRHTPGSQKNAKLAAGWGIVGQATSGLATKRGMLLLRADKRINDELKSFCSSIS